MSRYQFIQDCTELWPVQVLCRLLAVGTAGYYQWLQRPDAVAAPWLAAAKQAFTRHAAHYAPRRLQAELRAAGGGGRGPLRPALVAAPTGLACPEHPATAPAHDGGRPGGRGGRKPAAGPAGPTAPNQVWVGDITYLPLLGGRWCHLATWRNACSRRVVGGHLATQRPTELVLHALEQTLSLRQPAPGLIIHADRGSRGAGQL